MPGVRRTALIVPPLEVVTLAWGLRSLAHAETIGQPAGFLMTISRLEIVWFSWSPSYSSKILASVFQNEGRQIIRAVPASQPLSGYPTST
jgi:hypothetical protein